MILFSSSINSASVLDGGTPSCLPCGWMIMNYGSCLKLAVAGS
jgi:hypothetical protein